MEISKIKKHVEIGFIILHYLSLEETYSCVESILSLDSSDKMVIYIADNASSNQTGTMLNEHFKNSKNIRVLLLKNNYGFSHANNLTLKEMLEEYDPKYVIATNNDVVFTQKDLLERINIEYRKAPFYVLGPNVQTTSGRRQSPIALQPRSIEEVSRLIHIIPLQIKYINLFILSQEFLYYWKKIRKVVFREVNNTTSTERQINKEVRQYNVCLCGTCLIFSKDYLSYYSHLFYPETFFYHEEDILFYKMKKNNHLSFYTPEISVVHNNATSTKTAFKNRKRRMLFQLKNNLNSLQIYNAFILSSNINENENIAQ